MKVKLVLLLIMLALSTISTNGMAIPLRYDFSGTNGAALAGLAQGTYTELDLSLTVSAGSMDTNGYFSAGGGSIELLNGSVVNTTAILDIWGPRSDLPAGLGVRSVGVAGIAGAQVGPGEGLLFGFGSAFKPTSVTLSYFFGDGASSDSEDVRLFGDGVFLQDLFLGENGVVKIDLSGFHLYSTFSLTTRNCKFDCTGRPADEGNSDFVISYIDGIRIPIPEPDTLLLFILGLLLFRAGAGIRRKRSGAQLCNSNQLCIN